MRRSQRGRSRGSVPLGSLTACPAPTNLTSADLELELTTGKSGPVHDDVVLHEGVVLVPQGVEP